MPSDDLTFLFGEFVARCTHQIDKTFDDYQTLQYMAAGEVELSIGGRGMLLRGRNFWSCYPGPKIAFHAAAGRKTWNHRYIAFRGPLVARWEADGLFPIAPQSAPPGIDFEKHFDFVLKFSRAGDRLSQLRGIHELEGILIDLAEARTRSPEQPAWIVKVMRRFDELSAGQEVNYDAVAAEVGMTAGTLRRRFRAATGISPHQHVLQLRIAEARRALGESDEPIKAIAQRLGYRDVYFFSRQFRAITGVPPAMYRRSRQG
jgi:AraC-like DNA-binding protein